MTAEIFLPIVALITLCLVYLLLALDTALDSRRPWREWVRAVESWERRRREWGRL